MEKIFISLLLIVCNLFMSGCNTQEITTINEKNITYVQQYESQIIELVNNIRIQNGLNELVYKKDCSKLAKIKNDDMIANNYFDHKSPNDGYIDELAKKENITFKTIGENLYRITSNKENESIDTMKNVCNPEKIVTEWMSSPEHKENILSPEYDSIGVSVAYSNGQLYVTQVFMENIEY